MCKSVLRSGPWDREPNSKSWESHGFICNVVRNRSAGHLCGYVSIPSTHPCYGKFENDDLLSVIDVHGGITWSRNIHPKLKVDTGTWWLGFDCGHYGDIVPLKLNYGSCMSGDTYKNFEYVTKQVNNLAKQLSEIK